MSGEVYRDRIIISNDTRFLSLAREFIARMIRVSEINKVDESKIILAVDEAVTNIIEHGYESQKDGTIEMEIEAAPDIFRVVIRDSGKEFDPNSIKDPDMTDHVKKGKKKGLGIFLMRQIMDEVKYVFKEGVQNELILVKHLKKPGGAAPGPKV
ncbi:MAG: ATP-binding protein [Planctomycetes bacterium]|nr:ATP-binding protein [Planctomycetota bacterium]